MSMMPCRCECCTKREKHKWTFGVECITLQSEISALTSQLRSLQSQLEESEKSRKGLEVQVENLRTVGLALLAEAESLIHDQLDGTGNLDWALAELEPMRSVLNKEGK